MTPIAALPNPRGGTFHTTTGKAALAVLIPVGVLCLCIGALAALGGLALLGALRRIE